MKIVSTTLQAAILAQERIVDHRVLIDWDNDNFGGSYSPFDDVTRLIGSMALSQSLDSQLPAGVRLAPGAAVAQLDLTLNKGNRTRYAVASKYYNVSSASSGSAQNQTINVAAPAGLQQGELVVVALFAADASNALATLVNTNTNWATLALRADGTNLTSRVEGQLYVRRAQAPGVEPSVYTFSLTTNQSWVAAAVRVGDPNLMGITNVVVKGEDDDTTVVTGVTLPPVRVDVPGSTVVTFYAAKTAAAGNTWTASNGDTKVLDLSTAVAGQDQASMAVMVNTANQGMVSPSAALSGASVKDTLGFSIVFAPALAGDESQHAAWTYSELNPNSPFAGKKRFGRRTTWRVDFYGAAGREGVQVFTGLIIADSAVSSNRTATFTALDNRETLRYPFRMPLVVAENQETVTPNGPQFPGLEATFVVSYLLRYATVPNGLPFTIPDNVGPRNGYGYHASPGILPSNIAWIPCHGSVTPFEGVINHAYTKLSTGVQRRVDFASGPWVAGTEPAPIGGVVTSSALGSVTYGHWITTTKQIKARLEFYARLNQTTSQVSLELVDDPSAVTYQMRLVANGTAFASGTMQLNVNLPGGITRNVTGPACPTDGAWHFYGVYVDTVAASIIFRIDNTPTPAAIATYANATITAPVPFMELDCSNGGQIAECQATAGVPTATADIQLVTATTPFAPDLFVPSAFIDKSENALDALPLIASGTDTWSVLSDVASAEFAAIYFDGDGFPHYRNARSDASATGQTVQRLLTARQAVKDIAYDSSVQNIANSVSVSYSPLVQIIDQIIWSAQSPILVPGNSTITFTVSAPGLVLAVNGFVPALTGNTEPDGTGSLVTAGQINSVSSITGLYTIQVSVTNRFPWNTWLVDNTGQPTPKLSASWVAPDNANPAPVSFNDTESIRDWGPQPLNLSSSVWRQDQDFANSLAVYVLSELAQPSPVLKSVPIIGDPRLQIGDRGQLVDRYGQGFIGDVRITGLKHTAGDNAGYGQDLTVRTATTVAYWGLNYWDDGTVWGV
jgi:hypothetical protein